MLIVIAFILVLKSLQLAGLVTNLLQNKMNAQQGVLLTYPVVFATKDIRAMAKPAAIVFKVRFSMEKFATLAGSVLLIPQGQMIVLLEAK